MLVLVNANRLSPPIAPLGLEYIAAAARSAGIETAILDLNLADDAASLGGLCPHLVGISLRNVDDCFWPSATSFLPACAALVAQLRAQTGAPIVIGGVGFSAFGARLMDMLGADYGVRGDGERALVDLYRALTSAARADESSDRLSRVDGLIWSRNGNWIENAPAFIDRQAWPRPRDLVDNRRYFALGGQIGVETKRGCPRKCIYCADPVAKGKQVRYRDPELVADECACLLAQGIDVLHLCDGEFNVPRAHAWAVCEALVRRGLGERLRYYAYLAVRPFDRELATLMRRSGCVGINFTGDSASDPMLHSYRAAHRKRHLEETVRLCQAAGITCMVDLLLGGPGETPESVAETIETMKRIGPDCVGAGLGMRLYPETPVTQLLQSESANTPPIGVLRKYAGPLDLTQPTFYIAPALGPRPAALVRELIAGDPRFFPPIDEWSDQSTSDDHNYSDNDTLSCAIRDGARGAYWDILRQMSRD